MSFSPAEMQIHKANQEARDPASQHQIVQDKAFNAKRLGEYYLGTYLEYSA